MILYHPQLDLRLEDYGIDVPLKDQRASKTFEALNGEMFNLEGLTLLSQGDLHRVHTRDYVKALFDPDQLPAVLAQVYEREAMTNDKLLCQNLFATILLQCQASLKAFELALTLREKFCFFLGGGMHHARSARGSGFCVVHDAVIALERLKYEGKIQSAWVIDIDAHKGDGTAELAQTRPWLTTLSIHMAEGWPFGEPGYQDIPSTVDLPIKRGEESTYLQRLEEGLTQLEKMASTPDLVVVMDGADAYEHDELPGTQFLKLTLEQMLKRDQLVYQFCRQRGWPQAWLMAGGYGERSHEVYTQFLKWVHE